MYVAPETVSIEALWALIVSEFNAGTARLLICTLLRSPSGETSTVTVVMWPLATLTSTWTGPYRVSIVDPSNVPLAKPLAAATGAELTTGDMEATVELVAAGRVAAAVAATLVETAWLVVARVAVLVVALAWSA